MLYNIDIIYIIENYQQYLPIIFFVLTGLFIFVLLPLINKRFGPWSKLKDFYRYMGNPSALLDGETRLVSLLKFGMFEYKGMVQMRVTSQGMYFQPILFFKIGHPTLFIPWNEITKIDEADFPPESRTRTGLVLKGSKFQGIRFEWQLQRVPNLKMITDEDTGLMIEQKKKEFGF